ncbi:MAG: hypothetical protein ACOYJD_06925 [Christensenellales bacterium]|jgi:hypothetical protein
MSAAVRTLEMQTGEVTVSQSQIFRYMGLGGAKPDNTLAALTADCLAAFESVVRYKVRYAVLPVGMEENGISFGAFFAPGGDIVKHLDGCDKAIAFVATTGMEVEIQRKRAAVASPAQALVFDAIGTAAIECFCDALCELWQKEYSLGFLRSRFSPGYGDLPLELQKSLLEFLCSRRIGVALSDALLMIPQKSVSAFVGIGETGGADSIAECSRCKGGDCQFRL